MANVKITELTELSAADSNDADVFPIVDIDADATKKITIASLRTTVAAANDFVTFTRLNANVNIVQGNIAATVTESTAIEARRVANIAGAVSTITTGNLTASRAVVSDGSGKVAISDVTSTEIGYLDGVSSAIQTQIDAKSSTTNSAAIVTEAVGIEARRVANVAGAVSTITTADLTASRAVVSLANGKVGVSDVTSTEIGYLDGVSSALQTQLDTKIATTASASNDFVTYAQLNANINIVSSNAAAVESRRYDNSVGAVQTISSVNLVSSRALISLANGKVGVSDVTSTELGYLDGVSSAIQTQLNNTNASLTDNSNRIASNFSNTAAVEARRVANIAGAVSTITTADLTASKAVVSDGSGKVAVSAVTATELGYVDGVTSAIQTQLNDINTRATANATSSGAADAVEVRRVANIAGAVSTITTLDLTASRALVSLANGKVGVSAVTATELGYLDGVSSDIQTQLLLKAPLASPTFSGVVTAGHDLVVTGNLTVNGDTTTVNSENKIIQDRFIMLANAVTGAPSADVGIFFNRGNEGNAAIYYDESAKFFTLSETRDPDTNVAIFPTGAANLAVGHFTASSVKYNGADLNTAITDNRSGAVSTVYKDNLTASRAVVSDGSGKIAISDVTSTEIGYLDGVTSAIQTQLDAATARINSNAAVAASNTASVEARRVANVAGAVSTITDLNLTASRAVVSLANGKVGVSAVTATELGYLDGVSSAIQTQLDTKIATTASASNDFITYTQLNANINLVQDNVVSASGGATGVEARRVANIAGAVSTITTGNLTASRAIVSDGSGKVAISDVTSTEVGYLDGVSSAIQTQIDAKSSTTNSAAIVTEALGIEARRVANIAGAVSTITTADLTASRAVVSDGSGKVAISDVTSTEIGYLDGVTSAIQTQLNAATARINSNAAVAASNTSSVESRRVANIAGAVSTITTGNLTASRALVSDGSGKVAALASVTSTELAFLDATSSVQTQLDTKIATTAAASNDFITFTRLDANVNVVSSNASAVETKRVANIAGAISTITTGNLTASRAVVSDGSGKIAVSDVTATEVGYLDGVSSAIQTQLNAKQATLAGATLDLGTL